MWIVARFSPREWREPKLCDDCLTERFNRLNDYDEQSCNHETDNAVSENRSDKETRKCECEVASTASSESYLDYEHNYDYAEWKENDFNLSNSFWFVIGALMQQETDLNPKVYSFLQ